MARGVDESRNPRRFPNRYTLHPERFLSDLDEVLGRNRPDSSSEKTTNSQDTDEAPAHGMPRPKTGQ